MPLRLIHVLAILIAASPTIAQPTSHRPPTAPPPTDPPTAPAAPNDPPAAPFTLPRGDHTLSTTDLTIHDDSRDKDLELRIRIPTPPHGVEPPPAGWPLIVFSHGAGGSRAGFPDLLDFLASHGYASIAPTHSDSIELRRRDDDGAKPRDLLSADGRRALLASVKLGERVDDCSLVLDRLADISAAAGASGAPASPFTINPGRIAIAGHSAGAFTAQLCAGVKVRAATVGRRGLRFTSVADPRFKAAIVISGQGTTSRALGEDSWSSVNIPMFVITGSLDTSPPNMISETPESRQHPFTKSRGVGAGGPPAYLLYIEGATHSSYAGRATSSLFGERPTTDVRQIQDSVATGCLLFLDAHVRADAAAVETLNSARLAETIPGKVRYEWK